MNKNFSTWLFERRTAVLAVVVLVALLCSPMAAFASNNDLPWNTALERLVNAFSGRTALLVSMVGIFFAGGMLIFGGDLGNFGKMVMMIVLVGSMMGALSTIASNFISTEGCLILIRVIPVRKSLTRPQLICGCDRVLFLLLMLFCIALIFPGGLGSGNYVNVLIGIIFFFVGVQILAVLAKYDPLFSLIFSRAIKYQDAYVSTSHVQRQDKKY